MDGVNSDLGLHLIRPHHLHAVHKMRPIATDTAYVASSVCLCVGHMGELCNNG